MTVVALAGCRNDETSVTGAYGSAVISGQVTMADASSPAGVEVTAGGVITTLNADGRFAFVGVSDRDTTLVFRRSDGIQASLVTPVSTHLEIELSPNSAKAGRHRGVNPAAKVEYEGVVRQASPTSLVLFTSHQENVTVAIDATTVIRKGNTAVMPADLKTDDRVHIKATMKDSTLTATEIVVQNESDDDGEDNGAGMTMTANGLVTSNDGSSLHVQTQPKGEVTVKTDGNTTIKRQGERITAADIKTGDEVNAMGTRVDDHTLLAQQIEVRGNSKKNK